MAVTLPSDLVLDVMRMADPAKLKQASAKLSANSANAPREASGFAELLGRENTLPGRRLGGSTGTLNSWPSTGQTGGGTETGLPGVAAISANPGNVNSQPYVAFERMFLRNMFESLLPGEESGVYGGDMSSGIWRSMAADQLAGVYAEAGGLGIAHSLIERQTNGESSAQGQWPYFEANPIRSFVG